jgi:hypothetical protein
MTRRPRYLFAVLMLSLGLVGCTAENPGDLVSAGSASDLRPPASESAKNATTLEGPGLTLIAERSVDNCGIDATGTQPADYSRTYRCGLGRVVLYSVAGGSAIDAAAVVDSAMTNRGCVSENALSSNRLAVSASESSDPGSHAINTFYECGQDGAKAIFGLASDSAIVTDLPYLPPSPVGTAVVAEPAIPAEALKTAGLQGDRFVLVLHVSIEYFKTSVCNGLHRC